MASRLGSGRPARRLRIPSAEDLRVSLWALPGTAAALALVGGLVLSLYRPAAGTGAAHALWPGGRDAAQATLTALAGSVVTVTSLTFSLVVVALQLASQQFSPRLLREFARDRLTQSVLAVLFGTFVFAVTVLRGLDPGRPLPALALLVAFALGICSVFALLAFLGHIIRALRVDTMMTAVHSGTRATIQRAYPPHGVSPPSGELLTGQVQLVTASRSGFVQKIDLAGLVTAAACAGTKVEMLTRPGDQVVIGTPLAAFEGGAPDEPVAADVRAAIELGHERTLEQDVAYGFRQLVDIAVKALSPGVNDPETAAHVISHLSDLLCALLGRTVARAEHADDDGVPRVLTADHDLPYYLELSFGQIRRYGATEPTVLVALLRALRDTAASARDDQQREAISQQAERVLDALPASTPALDRAVVEDAAEAVALALQGRLREAYTDRLSLLRST